MAFNEDLAAFFTDFAETVIVAGVSGAALFDDGFATVLDGTVATSGPQLTVRQSDFPGAQVGVAVTVRSVGYTIVGIEPDGTGVAVLRLERN
jgi:hypothetical protein